MLLGISGASLLGDLLRGKEAIETSQEHKGNMLGRGTIRAGEGEVRVDQAF